MKKMMLGAGVCCVLLLTGCNDETTLTPGDISDPSFQSFQESFGDVESATNSMTTTMFDVVGDIFQSEGAPAQPTFQGITYSLEYNEVTEFWVAHLVLDDEAGSVAAFTDSLQFLVNGHPVRYPTLATLDLVRSFLTVNASGPQGSATGYQNLTAAPSLVDSTLLLTLNGNGALQGSFTHSKTDSAGTTDCTVDAAFSTSVSHVVLDITGDAAGQCPLSGTVSHTGNLHVVCTGAEPGEAEGHWTVTVLFENGVANVTAANGSNFWRYTESCEQTQ